MFLILKRIIAICLIAFTALGGGGIYNKLESNRPAAIKNLTNKAESLGYKTASNAGMANGVNSVDGISRDLDIFRRLENIDEDTIVSYYSRFQDRSEKFFDEDIYELPMFEKYKDSESVKETKRQLGMDKIDKKKQKENGIKIFRWVFRRAKEAYVFFRENVVKGKVYKHFKDNIEDNVDKLNNLDNEMSERAKEAADNLEKQKEQE